jgi:hypothetical protein
MKPARYFAARRSRSPRRRSAFAQPATAQQPYKIGAMLDVTGSASFLGKPEHNAIMLAVEEANQAGGIRGNKIELVFEDTKSTETDTVLAARKLINQAKVLAIIGPSRTGGAMAAIPVVTEAEVALLCLVSGVGVIQPIAERKWVIRPGQGGDLSGQGARLCPARGMEEAGNSLFCRRLWRGRTRQHAQARCGRRCVFGPRGIVSGQLDRSEAAARQAQIGRS